MALAVGLGDYSLLAFHGLFAVGFGLVTCLSLAEDPFRQRPVKAAWSAGWPSFGHRMGHPLP